MTAVNENENPHEVEQKKDHLEAVVGEGPWQLKIFLLISALNLPFASQNLVMSLFAPNLDYWCARPAGTNWSVEEWKAIALPPDDPKCSRYKFVNLTSDVSTSINHFVSNDTVSCDAWEYDTTFYGSTIVDQWNLVCSYDWLISMSKSIFIAGFLVSVMFFGYLSDKYGRRPFIAICNLIALVSAVICAFSVSYAMFAVSRFFIAFGVAGSVTVGFVLLMEVIGSEKRSFYGVGVNYGWNIGYVALPLIAWLLKDWFWTQIVITIPLLFLLPIWWMIPESPRWLLTNGQEEKAFEVLMKAAKANKVDSADISRKLKEAISKTNIKKNNDSVAKTLRLLWISGLWKRTLIVFYIWFVISFVYYGLSFNTNELAGDPFVNFAISGALEIPANFLAHYVIHRIGRRNPLAASLVVGGLACLLIYVIPEDPWWAAVVLSMTGKFCLTVSFSIVYVITAELFPTTVRNISLGSASMCARFGSIIAPFVRELGMATHPIVPQLLFGIISLIGGILTLLLPETNNQQIPDTIEEAADVKR